MGFQSNWGRIVRSLSSEYQILSFDQRGHGRSFQPESGYCPKDYAFDLAEVLKELNWSNIILVGHSMGARNAIYFSSKYPNLISKLAVLDISPGSGIESLISTRKMLLSIPTPFINREIAKKYFYEEFSKNYPLFLVNFLFSNLTQNKDKSLDWRFSKKAILDTLDCSRKTDLWNEWKSLKCPALVLRGELSTYLSLKDYEKMLQLQPYSKGVEVPETGHWLHTEKPDFVLESLKNFF